MVEIGEMEERDYPSSVSLFRVMTDSLHPPDVLISLRARMEVFLRQIASRRREFEQWIGSYRLARVRVLDPNSLDFDNREADLQKVIATIQTMLRVARKRTS